MGMKKGNFGCELNGIEVETRKKDVILEKNFDDHYDSC